MNLLTIEYDDDGNRLYYRDGIEVTEDEWMQQHPHMKGKTSGRERNSDSGRLGRGDEQVGAAVEPPTVESSKKERFKQFREESVKSGVPQGE